MAGLETDRYTVSPDHKALMIDRVMAVLALSKALETVVQGRARVRSARLALSAVASKIKALG